MITGKIYEKANSSLIKNMALELLLAQMIIITPYYRCHLAQMSDTDRVNGLLLEL